MKLIHEDLPKHPRKSSSGSLPKTIPKKAVKSTIRDQLSEAEEENTGLQAVDTADRAGSSALQMGKNIHETHEKRLIHRQETEEKAKASGKSNSQSRHHQKQQIQQDYRKAKSGKRNSSSAKKAAHRSEKKGATDRIAQYLKDHKHVILLLGLGFMLLMVVQSISGCSPLVESGLQALVIGTYPAEEEDIRAAERVYAQKEKDLKYEIEHYEQMHPGYDEYVVEAMEIWHDPYALIAIISAVNNGNEWTIDDAYGTIEKYFAWQYELTETVTSEWRYNTVIVDGEETKEWFQRTTCTVKLKNKFLSHSPVYTMSHQQMGLYALYMSTLGNMPHLFHGPHCSTLKDPLEYDVPQELLDADPKFALLIEEANKRIGYPYVWGGHMPETSFDCSGFISWIFTETGVRNIGHAGATGLYNMSQHISEAELLPGDLIFFTGTLGDDVEGNDGITHVAMYCGNGMMVHCGNPCSYYDIEHGPLRRSIAGYGRLYEH